LERELIAAARRESQRRGESPENAINEPTASHPTSLASRARQFVRPHKRLGIFVIALVVTGCAAVAATSLTASSERLALGRVDCYYGTYLSKPWSKPTDVLNIDATLVNGESPQAWCRQDFRGYSPAGLRQLHLTPVKDPKLVACRKNATTIAVLFASGRSDQCKHLGLAPLPRSYAAASSTARSLGTALRALYFKRNCWAPRPFAAAVRKLLAEHDLGSWRVFMPAPLHRSQSYNPLPGTYAQCSVFIYPNPYLGNPYQSIDGPNRSFTFELGMSHSDYELWNRVLNKLIAQTWRTCYTASAARALVDRAFAGTGRTVRLAVTRPPDPSLNFLVTGKLSNRIPRQIRQRGASEEHHYKLGCVIQPMIWLGANDKFTDVWLTVRHGRWIKAGSYAPPNSYFS
jgi:hypothetical protein